MDDLGKLACAVLKNGADGGFDDFHYVKEIADLRTPSRVGDLAVNWLSKHNSKPFFLFLHYFDVHSDYASLPQYEKQFVRPYNGIADGTSGQLLDFRRGVVQFDRKDAEHLIDLYDAGIRQMDNQIARLLRFIEYKNLISNTNRLIARNTNNADPSLTRRCGDGRDRLACLI